MAFNKVDKIWMNGQFVNWDDAKIHVLSHVIHYGSSVFEGQRCYKTPKGPACFRLKEHTERLFNSAKIYRMKMRFTQDEINKAILDVIAVNKLDECYIRPVAYRGYENLGVDPRACPVDVTIAAWPWGKYLGEEAMEKGVSVCVSSWNRNAPNTMPMMAKSGANYMNSQLIKLEAISHGYVEGIALDVHGLVSEARRTIIELAKDMGINVIEEPVPREALYIADEVFFTGSAAEVTPISQIDGIVIGEGRAGEITKKLQKMFFDIVKGQAEDKYGWLTMVPAPETVKA